MVHKIQFKGPKYSQKQPYSMLELLPTVSWFLLFIFFEACCSLYLCKHGHNLFYVTSFPPNIQDFMQQALGYNSWILVIFVPKFVIH